ncbi:MAG: homocysteine S-methyltransferase family protein [Pseudomonadota bacterium]
MMQNKKEILTILDGGLGRELQAKGLSLAAPLWSANAFFDNRDILYHVHCDFIKAGASVITTNSYALTSYHLDNAGKLEQHEQLLKKSYDVARKAVKDSGQNVMIAGSVPPLTESYRHDLLPQKEAMQKEYKFLLEQAVANKADIILAETLTTSQEAEVILEIYNNSQNISRIPVWISFTVGQDGNLRSGESLHQAASMAIDNGADAILINCASVYDINNSIEILSDIINNTEINCDFGVYPNRFTKIRQGFKLSEGLNEIDHELTIDNFVEFAHNWQQQGVNIIGGCCGIGCDYIQAISQK